MRMLRRAAPGLLLILLVQGCSEPVFEFRGYTDLSNCRQVIDAELARGATFEDAYDSIEGFEPELITELAGQLFEQDVTIEIACTARGSVNRIHYVVDTTDPLETGRAFIRFAQELDALFGMPAENATIGARSLNYICPRSSPVVLEEYLLPDDAVLDGEESSEEQHELYLAVVPEALRCVAAR
jgi:hypothetical protein